MERQTKIDRVIHVSLQRLIESRDQLRAAIGSGTQCNFVRRRRDGGYAFVTTSLTKELELVESEIEKREEFNRHMEDGAPVRDPRNFALAIRDMFAEERIAAERRKRGTQTNSDRGKRNYETLVRMCKENNIDFGQIAKKNLVSTFTPFFKSYGMTPIGETSLFKYQQEFKKATPET